jgi:predicted transcriptional regulator
MIGANNFFELSHPARQKILELVMESPKRHSDLAKALKIAPAEVTRHLRRLVQSDYIIKNDESRFVITQYGRIASRHLEIMDFIADNVDLFNQLDLSAIPVELMSYSILKDAGILKGPMKIFEKILQVTEMALYIPY